MPGSAPGEKPSSTKARRKGGVPCDQSPCSPGVPRLVWATWLAALSTLTRRGAAARRCRGVIARQGVARTAPRRPPASDDGRPSESREERFSEKRVSLRQQSDEVSRPARWRGGCGATARQARPPETKRREQAAPPIHHILRMQNGPGRRQICQKLAKNAQQRINERIRSLILE